MSSQIKLSKLTWTVIAGTSVSRAAFFMAFPFLAIHLKKSLGADLTTIGWILGAGPLAGSLVGLYFVHDCSFAWRDVGFFQWVFIS